MMRGGGGGGASSGMTGSVCARGLAHEAAALTSATIRTSSIPRTALIL